MLHQMSMHLDDAYSEASFWPGLGPVSPSLQGGACVRTDTALPVRYALDIHAASYREGRACGQTPRTEDAPWLVEIDAAAFAAR
jgi:hypothetical protein